MEGLVAGLIVTDTQWIGVVSYAGLVYRLETAQPLPPDSMSVERIAVDRMPIGLPILDDAAVAQLLQVAINSKIEVCGGTPGLRFDIQLGRCVPIARPQSQTSPTAARAVKPAPPESASTPTAAPEPPELPEAPELPGPPSAPDSAATAATKTDAKKAPEKKKKYRSRCVEKHILTHTRSMRKQTSASRWRETLCGPVHV